MNKGITKVIQDILVLNGKPMSGSEVYHAITGVPVPIVTSKTVKTLLTQRCKPQGKRPALWRKVSHDSYAAL